MAVKSIIEVDINDDKFKAFKALYDDYKSALDEAPNAWKEATVGIDEAEKSTKKLTETEKTREIRRKKDAAARKKDDVDTAKRWKEIGGFVASATAGLLKFASIGTGLATGAGAFGLMKLANDASSLRRQSMGLGISPGALSATRVNYQSALSSSDSTLAAIRDAQSDAMKQGSFAALGIKNYQGRTADELLPELIRSTQKLVKSAPQGQMLNIAEAYGATNFFSPEDLTLFKKYSEQELSAMIAKSNQDKKELNTRDSALKSFQDLKKQWDRFSDSIEKTWTEGLEPLTPALIKFSDSAATAFKVLMGSKEIEPILTRFGDGLVKVSTYISTPEFKKDFDDFKREVKDGATAFIEFLHAMRVTTDFLHITTPQNQQSSSTTAPSSLSRQEKWQRARPFLGRAAHDVGVDAGTLARIANYESGFDPEAKNPNSSAFGYGQFINGTWDDQIKKYAGKYKLDANNPERYRHDEGIQAYMLAEFTKENIAVGRSLGGSDDAANAYALHNLGQGGGSNFLRALKNNPNAKVSSILGSKVISGNPGLYGNGDATIAEAYGNMVRNMKTGDTYAQSIMAPQPPPAIIGGSGQQGGTRVVIENNTGGNVHVTAGAL